MYIAMLFLCYSFTIERKTLPYYVENTGFKCINYRVCGKVLFNAALISTFGISSDLQRKLRTFKKVVKNAMHI